MRSGTASRSPSTILNRFSKVPGAPFAKICFKSEEMIVFGIQPRQKTKLSKPRSMVTNNLFLDSSFGVGMSDHRLSYGPEPFAGSSMPGSSRRVQSSITILPCLSVNGLQCINS